MANSNEYMRKYMASRRAKRRKTLLEMFGGKCRICGSKENLEFDHINRETKSFILSGRNLDGPWREIIHESRKCDLLCRACHVKKSADNGEYSGGHNKGISKSGKLIPMDHGTAYLYITKKCRCINCKYARSLHRKKIIEFSEVIKAPSWYKGKPGRRHSTS